MNPLLLICHWYAKQNPQIVNEYKKECLDHLHSQTFEGLKDLFQEAEAMHMQEVQLAILHRLFTYSHPSQEMCRNVQQWHTKDPLIQSKKEECLRILYNKINTYSSK